MQHEGERHETEGEVVQVLPHDTLLVELASGQRVRAHLAGELRQHIVRVVLGDRVALVLSPFDPTRGRITRRVH